MAAVKGEWRYHDVKIVEVEGKGPDGKPNKTYNIEPRADGAEFDDSKWEVVAPETLKGSHVRPARSASAGIGSRSRSRPKPRARRSSSQTTVDDYGEIWVDGKLPRTPGKGGEAVVAGFNAPNRVELKDPKPGKVYQIAVFAINGPISAAPSNWLFLNNTPLEIDGQEVIARHALRPTGRRSDSQAAGEGSRHLRPGRSAAAGRDRSHQRI